MIERYCDRCKRKIDKYADEETYKPFYGMRAWRDIDLCLDCQEEWKTFRDNTKSKYDKAHDELYKQELKEVQDFLGIKEEEEECILEKLWWKH